MNIRFKKALTWILLATFGVLIACLVLEILTRVIDRTDYNRFVFDPASGLQTYRPGATFISEVECYENTNRINSLGFHAPEVPAEKAKNVFRIVVLGSSFVEGLQIPADKTFPILLQDLLNADPNRAFQYEVIPFGYSGNATYLDTLYYDRFGSPLHPDLVIDFMTEYERTHEPGVPRDDAGNIIFTSSAKPQSRFAALKGIYHQSTLFMNLLNRYALASSHARELLSHPSFFMNAPALNAPQSASSTAASWSLEDELVSSLAARVKADNARFVVASWNTPQVATSSRNEIADHVGAIARTNGFSYLNLDQSIAAQSNAEGTSPSWPCDDHWSANGHRYAANALFDFLKAQRIVPTKR